MDITKTLGFVTMFLLFIFVYFGAHLYVSLRISNLFLIKRTIVFYVVVFILALSFPLMSIIERFIDGKISTMFYTISSVWLGVIFYLLITLIIYEFVKLFVKIDSKIAGIAILVIVVMITIYAIINAAIISTKEIEVLMPNINNDLKIVHLSDIHIGTINNDEYLQKVVDKTNAQNPDIVLITGDLVDGGGLITSDSFLILNNIKAKTFFSTGNHEQYDGLDNIILALNKTKVTVLRNEVVTYKGIQIIGIDDPGHKYFQENNPLESIKINKSKPSILMHHQPNNFEIAEKKGINLQLSGHTHDGQLFPFNILVRLEYKYVYGLHKYNNMYIYVSSGTGTWGPPFRLGSKNEVVLINLIKKK
ncbi:MAG: metallophosphoesterase [Candidatus Woesearchaeota archaeon]|jgi:hypothetical protein